jgi:hypothetical protein
MVPKPKSHVKVTGRWFWNGFQDGILVVSKECRGAAGGVPKRLVFETATRADGKGIISGKTGLAE